MLFAELLARRVRADGARPLLTCYPGGGERTELSAISYANWVAKTANLLDELGAGPGDVVALPVLRDHPASWMALAWVGACWTVGCVATPTDDDVRADDPADVPADGPAGDEPIEIVAAGDIAPLVVVTGPTVRPAAPGQTVVACSLHPMGLGFHEALPSGAIDWAAEVRVQPDDYTGPPLDPGELAWSDGAGQRSQADLPRTEASAGRMLVVADDPWATVRDALLGPLVGGGSAVVVGAGVDPAERARLAASERVGA